MRRTPLLLVYCVSVVGLGCSGAPATLNDATSAAKEAAERTSPWKLDGLFFRADDSTPPRAMFAPVKHRDWPADRFDIEFAWGDRKPETHRVSLLLRNAQEFERRGVPLYSHTKGDGFKRHYDRKLMNEFVADPDRLQREAARLLEAVYEATRPPPAR